MAKLMRRNGSTSNILRIFLEDSTSAVKAGKTGLAFDTSGLVISTIANNEATATTYTSAGSTIETISTLGTYAAPTATKCRFKEVDSTNQPGVYELQLADARYAISGAKSLFITIHGVANTVTSTQEIDLAAQIDTNTDAILSGVVGIGTAGGAAINVDATVDNVAGGITGVTSTTTFAGTQSSGTYASTSNVNAVYHTITGTASGNTAMDIVYQFLTGAGTNPVQCTWVGYVTSANDTITVSCWRHDTNAWESMTTIVGTATATTQTKNITLYSRHRGTSTAELGKVYMRLHCTGMTTPVVATDQIAVSYSVTSRGTYSDGAVWLNTAASNTNTQNYVDGLPENPVSTIAAAITICDSLNLKCIRVANGSTVTFGASMANRSLVGKNWTCALGGQAIDGLYVEGAEVSGIGTCTTQAEFVDCHINNSTTLGPSRMLRCGFDCGSGTPLAGGSAGEFIFVDCFSEVASGGATTPYFTFTGASAVQFRRYSGGANVTLDANTAALTYEVIGGGGLTVAMAGADLEVRGMPRDITLTGITSASTVRINAITGNISLAGADGAATIYGVSGTITDSRTGSPTLTNRSVSRDTVNTEADTAFSDYAPATATALATLRGTDNDTLKTLSEQLDSIPTTTPLDAAGIRTAVGMSTANLDTQLGDLPTNSELATALAGADDAVLAAISGLNNLSSVGAQAAAAAALAAYSAAKTGDAMTLAANAVNSNALAANAVDEIWNKAMTELATVPGVTGTVLEALEWVFLRSRNKTTQTHSQQSLRNHADDATIGSADTSDDGLTFTRGTFS